MFHPSISTIYGYEGPNVMVREVFNSNKNKRRNEDTGAVNLPVLGRQASGALASAEFTARGRAFRFPKGQSGNPDGQSRFYHECRKLAREASPEMMRELIELAKTAEDERVRSVCLVAVLDRAGIRGYDHDPKADGAELINMSDEELAAHTAKLLIEGGMARSTALAFVRRSLRLDREAEGRGGGPE
jgi:hypothetical protein